MKKERSDASFILKGIALVHFMKLSNAHCGELRKSVSENLQEVWNIGKVVVKKP